MADDQASPNEGGDEGDAVDYGETTAVTITNSTTPAIVEYDDDEPIEDFVINMVVNEQPDGVTISPDLLNVAITDIHGNIIGTKPNLYGSITTAIYDELNGSSTAITGGKRWWGWSTQKMILVGLVALCILGIILAILFLVMKKKKNKRSPPATTGPITATKAVVTKSTSPDPKYQPVPNV